MIKVNLQKDWILFEPEFMNNKACKKEERVSCMIKLISQADQDKMTDKMIDQNRKGFRTEKGIKFSSANLEMIDANVKEIKNVFVIDGEEDYYWVYDSRKGIYHSSCVGGWIPLKGFVEQEKYDRMVRIWNLNNIEKAV